jgi:hypothetical protein
LVPALADLEKLGFITRIRRIRRVMTPPGFTTRQITNAYDVHEPRSGLGLLAIGLDSKRTSDGFAASDSIASGCRDRARPV